MNKEDDYIWKIPLKVSKGRSQLEFMFEEKKMISLMDFYIVDPNVRGYYRVSYEDDSLDRFLNKKNLAIKKESGWQKSLMITTLLPWLKE